MEGLEISILKLSELNVRNDRFRFDAEFVKKEFLQIEKFLKQREYKLLIDTDCKIIHPTEIKRKYVDQNGIWFFRAQNIRPLRIETTNIVFISKDDMSRLEKNKLNKYDVVITRTGANFGQTTLYNVDDVAVGSSHTFILRNSYFSQAYLAVFFNTFFGRKLIDKGMYGGLQPEISSYYLLHIPIPEFSSKFQKLIENIILNSEEFKIVSEQAYTQAETLLLETLGLPSPSCMKGCPRKVGDGVVDKQSFPPYSPKNYHQINNHFIKKKYIPNLPYNPTLKKRAKALRKAGVLSEVLFWQQVHKGKFYGIDFDRQWIIGNYIVDFYVKSLGLLVEIDGGSHDFKEDYDVERQQYLESLGLKIFRIEDIRVRKDLMDVMQELENLIVQHYKSPRPTMSGTPPKEGKKANYFSGIAKKKMNYNIKSFKESFGTTGRLDAEYYQKKYEQLLSFIEKKTNWKYLEDITTYVSNGNQPPYSKKGKIRFFSQKWIGDKSIDYSFLKSTNEPMVEKTFFDEPKNKSSLVGKGDILYYSVGANLGYCHIYLKEEKIAVGSYINIIRANKSKVNRVYLAVVLNSLFGRLQGNREKSEIAQPYIYAKNIREFKIPLVSMDKQVEIANKIQKSFALKKQSFQFLAIAKTAVEKAIEKDEETAITYIQRSLTDLKIKLCNN